ncbi:MAG: hypothetical protein AB2L14_24120 [Candidatus Xenobiia bacterium LiM19]
MDQGVPGVFGELGEPGRCAVQKTMSKNPDEGSRQAAVERLMQGMKGVSAAGPVR